MRKTIYISVACCIAASGCSAFVPRTETVTASCSVPDAKLQVDGGQIYQGKATFQAVRNRVLSVACYKRGYYPAQKSVSFSISWTGVVDVLSAFVIIVPAVGVFLPGTWELNEKNITVNMVQME